MGTVLLLMAVPWLYALGYGHDAVNKHGRCVASPGSYKALFCSGAKEVQPPPHVRHHVTHK
jgi:hypothetical protein